MAASNNYQMFISKYDSFLQELLNFNYKKAHTTLISCMSAYRRYVKEIEGVEKENALLFGKELRALEKYLSETSGLYKPSAQKAANDDILANVAGLESVKEELKRVIIYPQTHPELYAKFKKPRGGGLLFYGVPGTGKTRIAKEVAREIDAHFIEVKCSSILSRWLGDSEKNIREIFDEARNHKLSIIFFDEFEAIGGVRGSDKHEATSRLVAELLSQIQGFGECESNVILIAATNRPWDIDSAFLRPGRFGTQIYIPLPDEVARRKIVTSELEGLELSSDFNLEEIVSKTNGFNRADVVEFCERLKDEAIKRVILFDGSDVISNEDITTVSSKIRTSVRKQDLEQFKKYIKGIRQLDA